MKVRFFRSGKGDCALLTSTDGKHLLVDGGVPEAYADHWAADIGRLRTKGEAIDLICISHIDRDHIGGVLAMLDAEAAWRLHDIRNAMPAALAPKKKKAPAIPRPPEVKGIWHNAFFEQVRTVVIGRPSPDAAPDLAEGLFRTAGLLAGGKTDAFTEPARHLRFLGQSVGDAIEVSRRIASDQLGIPLNKAFRGDFVLRGEKKRTIALGSMRLRVLSPTAEHLAKLVVEWDKWLEKSGETLARLIDKHEREADALTQMSPAQVLARARAAAIAFAGSQAVTPPNLASIVLHIEDGGRTILMTGDADDPDILAGLEAAGLADADGRTSVDILKVPHHGAHNSYSDDFARRVVAKNYVFCGDGEHDNPEPDILDGYLNALLVGSDGFAPALPAGRKATFWFTSGPALVTGERPAIIAHWDEIADRLEKWRAGHPRRFAYRFMGTKSASFLVR